MGWLRIFGLSQAFKGHNKHTCQLVVAQGMFNDLGSSIDEGMMSAIWLLQESASCTV